jgi:hypothetical protein
MILCPTTTGTNKRINYENLLVKFASLWVCTPYPTSSLLSSKEFPLGAGGRVSNPGSPTVLINELRATSRGTATVYLVWPCFFMPLERPSILHLPVNCLLTVSHLYLLYYRILCPSLVPPPSPPPPGGADKFNLYD